MELATFDRKVTMNENTIEAGAQTNAINVTLESFFNMNGNTKTQIIILLTGPVYDSFSMIYRLFSFSASWSQKARSSSGNFFQSSDALFETRGACNFVNKKLIRITMSVCGTKH
jgi:hypothetical protein